MKSSVIAPWAEPVPDAPVTTLSASDTLEGLDVLPGFTLRIADLFL